MTPTEGRVARPEQRWGCRRSTPDIKPDFLRLLLLSFLRASDCWGISSLWWLMKLLSLCWSHGFSDSGFYFVRFNFMFLKWTSVTCSWCGERSTEWWSASQGFWSTSSGWWSAGCGLYSSFKCCSLHRPTAVSYFEFSSTRWPQKQTVSEETWHRLKKKFKLGKLFAIIFLKFLSFLFVQNFGRFWDIVAYSAQIYCDVFCSCDSLLNISGELDKVRLIDWL